jgi:pimeloyl-ACP methyl ester carboxylesterase
MPTPATKLVLMPGLDGTSKLFAEFERYLPNNFIVASVLYPVSQRLGYSELVPFIRSAAPAIEPFVLVAESFSTPLAIQYASTRPPNLIGVVLCAGFAKSPLAGWRRRIALLFGPVLFRLPLPRFALKSLLVGTAASPILLTAVRKAISSVPARTLTARLRAALTCDARAELSRMTVPLLYLQAKRDRLVRASCGEEIMSIKTDTKLESLDSPHLLLQCIPQETAAVVTDFVRQCSE